MDRRRRISWMYARGGGKKCAGRIRIGRQERLKGRIMVVKKKITLVERQRKVEESVEKGHGREIVKFCMKELRHFPSSTRRVTCLTASAVQCTSQTMRQGVDVL